MNKIIALHTPRSVLPPSPAATLLQLSRVPGDMSTPPQHVLMPRWALRTRSGLNYAAAFRSPATLRTGRSFVDGVRRAFECDDAGLDSPPPTPFHLPFTLRPLPSASPQTPSAPSQLPSASPQLPTASPQLPSAPPQLPSAPSQPPSAPSQPPSASPQTPSASPQPPSASPQTPSVSPQTPSASPQPPSASPQLPSAPPQPPFAPSRSSPTPPQAAARSPASPLTPLSDADSMEVPRSILSSPPPWMGSSPLTVASVGSLPSDLADLPPMSDLDLDSEGGWLSDSGCSGIGGIGDAPDYASSSEYGGGSENGGELEFGGESEYGGDSEYGDGWEFASDAAAAQPSNKRKRKFTASDGRAAKKRKQRKRQAAAQEREPTDPRRPTFRAEAASIPTALSSAADMPACSTGFTALRLGSLKPGKAWTLKELRKMGYRVHAWDGRKPIVILDNANRIVAVLAGRPAARPGKPDDWDEVVSGLECAIGELQRSCTLRKGDKKHRRGPHAARAFGISHGGGQKRPSVLALDARADKKAFRAFKDNRFVKRVAGFGSSAFSCFAPKLYSRYCDYFTRLLKHDATLLEGWNFDNSIFPTTTVNFGPDAVCYDHLDFANAAAGWCAITSTGNYDPKRGGHLVLFDIDTIIEFPPGSTILIPSSVMRHGNTPIQAGETRSGITQYAAGALFRWVDNGFMTAEDTSAEVKARMAAEAPERFRQLLSLYSTLDSLAADTDKIFGK
ncbi:hypothetical protein HWV62_26158 [Athelia sp. TMB]|nr:hypothetical protein HWV62_26158 [Athelia sp. TMB]